MSIVRDSYHAEGGAVHMIALPSREPNHVLEELIEPPI